RDRLRDRREAAPGLPLVEEPGVEDLNPVVLPLEGAGQDRPGAGESGVALAGRRRRLRGGLLLRRPLRRRLLRGPLRGGLLLGGALRRLLAGGLLRGLGRHGHLLAAGALPAGRPQQGSGRANAQGLSAVSRRLAAVRLR